MNLRTKLEAGKLVVSAFLDLRSPDTAKRKCRIGLQIYIGILSLMIHMER